MGGTALVLGLGSSGESAARLLAVQKGMTVTVLDAGDSPELRARVTRLADLGIAALLGARSLPAGSMDFAVLSPGIPVDSAWVRELVARGVWVRSELSLGLEICESQVLAVTGSKGKSTFAKFCHDALVEAGFGVGLGGNYGPPATQVCGVGGAGDWVVLEVSSFQLETTESAAPRVGVLLNVQPDHLDRHGTLDRYFELKARLFEGMTESGVGIVPIEWLARVRGLRSGARNRWLTFGTDASADVWYRCGAVWMGGERVVELGGTYFDNSVLGLAAAAAVAALAECGVSYAVMERTAGSFQPLAHRMQRVAECKGVVWINDSKATSLTALGAALEMVAPKPVRLIAGGRLKEKDLGIVKEILVKTTRRVYLIGESAQAMKDAWQDVTDCVICGGLAAAAKLAAQEARSGEIVLLSPGCASFDQFRNFEERGERFATLARECKEGLLE